MFMSFGRFAAIAASGAYLASMAIVIDRTAEHPPSNVSEMRSCIASEFSETGFEISHSNNTSFDGYVSGRNSSGPEVTVTFGKDDSAAKLSIRNSEIPVTSTAESFSAIQSLANQIATRCERLFLKRADLSLH
jgi:hypothetical protein